MGKILRLRLCWALPAISLGSMALVPYDQGKFARLGSLSVLLWSLPNAFSDVEVPYWAEMIEGEIWPAPAIEGPFGEFTNYACFRSTENVFILKPFIIETTLGIGITPGMYAEHNT